MDGALTYCFFMSNEDYKARVRLAMESYLNKNRPKSPGTTRKNTAPEKETVKLILKACDSMGFSCHVVESKAVYSQAAGRYLNSQANPGFPDIVGCDQLGRALWIEVKAPGRRSTLKEHQRQFLISKIDLNCFAVCVDGPDQLLKFYREWIQAETKKAYLLKVLP